jgi:hypothetical protein
MIAVGCLFLALSAGTAAAAEKAGNNPAQNPAVSAAAVVETGAAPVSNAALCSLSVSTEPSGASVYVDDSLMGTSPVVLSGLLPGGHMLMLKKKGCFLKKVEITLDPAGKNEFSFVLLQPGLLKVISEPAGAEVWIDEKREGVTPYQTDRIKPGDHVITLALRDYVTAEKKVTMANGGMDTVTVTLERTRAFKEQIARAQVVKEREHRERVYLGLVSALFIAGAALMVFLEAIAE